MKKYLYHYSSLVLALAQLVIIIATVVECADSINTYGKLDGSDIAGIVIIFILLYFTAMIDRLLRKVDDHNFFVDCLLLTLVSPIRFICQIITIVRLHIAMKNGDLEFGKRGSDGTLYYLIFSTYSSASIKRKKERDQLYNDIINRMDKELDDAQHFLRVNRRSDGYYNVYIVPLCCVDSDKITPFSVQNNSYTGERYINELYVNGKKIIYDVNFSNTIVLSLRPGKYDFKVVVKGNVTPVMVTKKVEKVNKTFELKNVYVGDEDVHLLLGLLFGSVITQYIQKYRYTKKIVREEFEYFKRQTFFNQVSVETLTELCDYWMAYRTNIDQVYTQYSIGRK